MKRILIALMAAASTGCGLGIAPIMLVSEQCNQGDLTVQLELGYSGAHHCDTLSVYARAYEDEYDLRFGHQGPVTVRLRNTQDLRTIYGDSGFTIGGHTSEDGIIDIALGQLEDIPHELNHVRTGPGHGGWCRDYNPWSIAILGWDQSGYLGCKS